MMGGQPNPYSAQLRMWAWISGGWILAWILIVVALIAVASHSSGTQFDTTLIVTTTP